MFAEDALLFESLADRQHTLFDFHGGTVGGFRRSVGLVGPVDSVQSLAIGSCLPSLNRGGFDAELFGDVTDRLTTPNGLDVATSIFGRQTSVLGFYSYSSRKKIVYKITISPTVCPVDETSPYA